MPQAVASAPQTLSVPMDGLGEADTPRFTLGLGLTYRVIFRSHEAKSRFVAGLAHSDLTAVVPCDGGFLGNLKVWENLVLPATYHGRPRLPDLETRAAEIFARIGGSPEQAAQLCGELPARLSPIDLRRAAFVRAMLCEPELMVYDSLWEGIARHEIDTVLDFDRVFHLYFPFRTSLWADRDTPGLPDVAANQTFVIED